MCFIRKIGVSPVSVTSIPGRIVEQIIKRLVYKHFYTLRINLSRTSIFKLNQIAFIAVIDQH